MAFQATVILTAITPGIHPKQRLLELNADRSRIPIGRASKSPNKGLTGKVDNCWFDSPVMSREHAELFFDGENKSLFLKDIRSMHGTRLNGSEIPVMMPQILKDGDKIVFGAEVRRGFDIFPACEFLVEYYIVSWRSNSAAFEVPYSSDIEEEQISDHEYYEDDERISTTSHRDDETPVESPVQKLSIAAKSGDVSVAELKVEDSASELQDGHAREHIPDELIKEPLTGNIAASDAKDSDPEDSDMCDSDQESDHSDDSLDIGEETEEREAAQFDNEILDTDYGDDDAFEVNDSFSPNGFSNPQELDTSMQTLATVAEAEQTAARDDATFELKNSGLCTSTLPLPWQTQSDAAGLSLNFDKFPPSSAKEAVDPNSIAFMDEFDVENNCNFARTPSPSDAAMVKKTNSIAVHHLPHQQWQEFTSAQILGEKSGKHAYFAAREDNKAKMGTAQFVSATGNEWMSPWIRTGQQLPPLAPNAVHEADSVNQSELHVSVTLQKEQAQNTSLLIRKEAVTSSGKAIVSEANRAGSPELDMTSAASFAVSKALLEQHRPHTRSGVSIDDLVEHPIVRDLKRKASEISEDELNQRTELNEDVSASLQALEEVPASIGEPQDASREVEQRPAKKFRRFAEAVGYAALGGVAVGAGLFSILVATAPDFV